MIGRTRLIKKGPYEQTERRINLAPVTSNCLRYLGHELRGYDYRFESNRATI